MRCSRTDAAEQECSDPPDRKEVDTAQPEREEDEEADSETDALAAMEIMSGWANLIEDCSASENRSHAVTGKDEKQEGHLFLFNL